MNPEPDTRYVNGKLTCCECGRTEDDRPWMRLFERRGKIYCETHLLNTPDKRAYERWFVEPRS